MCATFLGTINLSCPTSALPVARTRCSPSSVSGMSVRDVCRPSRDHSVSPWRMMKTRGVCGIFWWLFSFFCLYSLVEREVCGSLFGVEG